jgi:hypothetical protein
MSTSYPVLLGRVVIDASNKRIVLDEGGGDLNADLAEGTYYLRGDGAAGDLADAIADALNAVGGQVYLVTVDYTTASASKTCTVNVATAGSTDFVLKFASSTFDALLLVRGSRASDPDDMAVLRLLTAVPALSGDPEADRRGSVLQLRKPIADAELQAVLLAARDRLRAAP